MRVELPISAFFRFDVQRGPRGVHVVELIATGVGRNLRVSMDLPDDFAKPATSVSNLLAGCGARVYADTDGIGMKDEQAVALDVARARIRDLEKDAKEKDDAYYACHALIRELKTELRNGSPECEASLLVDIDRQLSRYFVGSEAGFRLDRITELVDNAIALQRLKAGLKGVEGIICR